MAPSRARWEASSASTPAATASCRRAVGVTHRRPRVGGGQAEQRLHLGRGEVRVLGPDQGADPGDVRRREAVAGRAHGHASIPGHPDVDAAGEELDRWVGVAVVGQRILQIVACDRDHRREPPRVARHRHVVRRGDDDAAPEVGGVGQLVQRLDEAALGGREAHVDDVVALLDRPAQPLDQHRAAADEALVEHAHAVELAVRRELADDSGARGAVPAQVAQGVGLDQHLVVDDRDGHRLAHLAHPRVARLDAAVDHADTHAPAGRPAERPVARDAVRATAGRPPAAQRPRGRPRRRGGSRRGGLRPPPDDATGGGDGPRWRRRGGPGGATESSLQLVAVRLDVGRVVVVGLVGRRVVREQLVLR